MNRVRESARRALAGLLAALLLWLPPVIIPRVAWAESEVMPQVDVFNCADASLSMSALHHLENAEAASRTRTEPVSAIGSFTTRIPFDVPTGRGAMTPSLALTCDNSDPWRDSGFGAGFSLSVLRIARSTMHGTPPLQRLADGSWRYEDTQGGFIGSAGEMAPWVREAGTLPRRETAPGVCEYSPHHDSWLEHVHKGRLRFYGKHAAERSRARVVNEAGQHTGATDLRRETAAIRGACFCRR